MYSEKRRQDRKSRPLWIEVTPISIAADAAAPTRRRYVSEEASEKGLSFRSDEEWVRGSRLRIRVEQPSSGRFPVFIEHVGTVRGCRTLGRTGGWLVGVEFTGTTPAEMQKWLTFMNFRSDPLY
jgi:hypothetical protein